MSHRFENAYALLIAVDQNLEAARRCPPSPPTRAPCTTCWCTRSAAPMRPTCAPADRRRQHRQGILDGLDWLAERVLPPTMTRRRSSTSAVTATSRTASIS
ncbi:MAG: hypothetical protein V5B36_13170 [Candidatus Accumulibacter sp. UW25]|jgi:hypothetical protein